MGRLHAWALKGRRRRADHHRMHLALVHRVIVRLVDGELTVHGAPDLTLSAEPESTVTR